VVYSSYCGRPYVTHCSEKSAAPNPHLFIFVAKSRYPPDPIYDVCYLSGIQISRNYLIHHSVQIFDTVQRTRSPKIWFSAQDDAVLVLLFNMVECFISAWPKWSDGNDLSQSGTSSRRVDHWGWPFNIFNWFRGSGGSPGNERFDVQKVWIIEACRAPDWTHLKWETTTNQKPSETVQAESTGEVQMRNYYEPET